MIPFAPSLSFKLLVAGIIAAALFASGIWLGIEWNQGQVAQEQLEQQALSDALTQKLRTDNDTLNTQLSREREAQKPKDRIITKEVIRYEQVVPAASRCTLSAQWRMLHDAAATGEPPDTGRYLAGADGPVTDAEAIETVADNYETCRECQHRVSGWQRYWRVIEGTGCAVTSTGVDPSR
jgi:apolipoprotein N-acyltransferase